MTYTDAQMIIASQIAYLDFDMGMMASGEYTVREYLEQNMANVDADTQNKYRELLEKIDTYPGCQECGNWIVRDVDNQQHTSGMYGCLIDTGNGDAIIAFRGSESDTLENQIKDWLISDVGLINNVLTPQQATAEAYIRKLYAKYGEQYGSFALTGHSLGGNLAEHATITAPDAMRDKITQCLNLDGPGFSNQYMIAHRNDIDKAKDVISHYQWSLVGTALTPIPGAYYQTIEANTPEKDSLLESMVWRHDTCNVVYDENGNAVNAKRDWLAELAGPISQGIDLSIFAWTRGGFGRLYNTADKIRDGLENLISQWNQYRNRGNADAQFEMHLNQLDRQLEEFPEIMSKIQALRERMEQVQKNLAFESVASGYVKVRLWTLANNLNQDVNKCSSLQKKGRECVQCCRNHEQSIENNYK